VRALLARTDLVIPNTLLRPDVEDRCLLGFLCLGVLLTGFDTGTGIFIGTPVLFEGVFATGTPAISANVTDLMMGST